MIFKISLSALVHKDEHFKSWFYCVYISLFVDILDHFKSCSHAKNLWFPRWRASIEKKNPEKVNRLFWEEETELWLEFSDNNFDVFASLNKFLNLCFTENWLDYQPENWTFGRKDVYFQNWWRIEWNFFGKTILFTNYEDVFWSKFSGKNVYTKKKLWNKNISSSFGVKNPDWEPAVTCGCASKCQTAKLSQILK